MRLPTDSRHEQEAMDKLLAERLAEAESTDQQTLQNEIQHVASAYEPTARTVFVVPDGLECPITNE